jgi:radical SAM superfamily enzyme YgiQ (UPF0313 family)
MKCTLIRGPQLLDKFVSAGYAVPPVGMAYIAGSLRAAGHDVQVIDSTGEAIDQFEELGRSALRRGLSDAEVLRRIGTPDVIGFSLMFSQDWPPTRDLIKQVRARHPRAILVGGGEHFTAEPIGALEDSPLDYVIAGEGDIAICDLLERIQKGEPVETVPGLYYRAGGEIKQSKPTARARDIDKLAWPAWDLFPIETYLAGGHGWGVDRGRNMPLNATRGCPYRCTFCSSPTMWTTRWVSRSPRDVVDEIKHYIAKYRATNFDFHDLTAIIKKEWVIEFCNILIEENLNITWQLPTGTRSEALDDEVFPLLWASGCRNITYAPESGSDVILEKIKKKIKRERMVHSMRRAVKAGCSVKANFIFGFPGDRVSDYWQTFGFLGRMALAGVHDISIAPFRPYPGSELFRQLQATGVIPKKLDDTYYTDLASAMESLPLLGRIHAKSYSEHMSPQTLHRLRTAALSWFYGLSFLVRPHRVAKLAYAVLTERQESRLDKSLVDMKQRIIKSWRSRGKTGLSPGPINPY